MHRILRKFFMDTELAQDVVDINVAAGIARQELEALSEDYVLANDPEFVTSLREADEDLAAGHTVSLD